MKLIESFGAAGLDFDGTIADTRAAMTQSRLESFLSVAEELADERYALIDNSIHAEAHHHGSHAIEIIGWVMLQAGIIIDFVSERDTVQHVVDRRNEIYWDKAQHGFDPVPGALETIRDLHDSLDGKITIVTTAPVQEEVIPYLKRHGLLDMFDPTIIVGRESVTCLKPDPEAYNLALDRLDVTPDRFIALEDAHAGVVSARQAGIAEVIALTTTHTSEQLANFPPDQRPSRITPTHGDFQKLFFTD